MLKFVQESASHPVYGFFTVIYIYICDTPLMRRKLITVIIFFPLFIHQTTNITVDWNLLPTWNKFTRTVKYTTAQTRRTRKSLKP